MSVPNATVTGTQVDLWTGICLVLQMDIQLSFKNIDLFTPASALASCSCPFWVSACGFLCLGQDTAAEQTSAHSGSPLAQNTFKAGQFLAGNEKPQGLCWNTVGSKQIPSFSKEPKVTGQLQWCCCAAALLYVGCSALSLQGKGCVCFPFCLYFANGLTCFWVPSCPSDLQYFSLCFSSPFFLAPVSYLHYQGFDIFDIHLRWMPSLPINQYNHYSTAF